MFVFSRLVSGRFFVLETIAVTLFLGVKAPLGLTMGVTVSVSVSVSHEKVSRLQDVARTSYIRYLPTITCKDLLVLLSPPCLC